MQYRIAVITEVPELPDTGNMANPYVFKKGEQTPDFDIMTNCLTPVFVLGEILILDELGREVGGKERKPSKWGVTCEEFSTLDDAIAKALTL